MNIPLPPNRNSDVRMKGFTSRITVDNARQWLDASLLNLSKQPAESLSLASVAGRVLAEDAVSRVNVPGFARSMMDGFALQAEETYGATSYNALQFQILGTSLPGVPFPGNSGPGQTVRIMTGAPIPDGTNAVLPVENTEVQGQTLFAMGEVSAGKHVGAVGEDVRKAATVLKAGRVLRPQDIGVLSSIGMSTVPVIRKPRVRILITGNELLPAGTVPEGYQIADSNGPMLAALVARDGGLPIVPDIIPDNREALLAAMNEPADFILISGGSSVGQEDHAPRLLAEHGELAIHGVAMRPSSPAGMGRLNGAMVFLLPGNPVSCLCAYDFFAGRAIRALGGYPKGWPYRQKQCTLTRKLVSTVGRVDYARVRITGSEAEPLAISGASVLTSTTLADGFVIVADNSEGAAAGSTVEVFLYD